jgi:peroxiredoxin
MLAWLGSMACASASAQIPTGIRLVQPQGGEVTLERWLQQNRYMVVLFVSASCPCVHAHAARLRELSERYAPLGVQFIAVDSERDATPGSARSQQAYHDWRFPVLLDPQGQLAERLDAEYASYAVVLDAQGSVRYRGGVDSDRKTLHADATPHLANALDDLIAQRAVRVAQTEALGCVLRRNGT